MLKFWEIMCFMDMRKNYITPELEQFIDQIAHRTSIISNHKELQQSGKRLFDLLGYDETMYVYNFLWAGIPSIQLPQDLIVKQELIWECQPNVIVETGVAWAGGLAFYNSMLMLLEMCGIIQERRVAGIDIEIRDHTKKILEAHPLCRDVLVFEGSSVTAEAKSFVQDILGNIASPKPLFVLDSFHSKDHVLQELELFAPLVPNGGYIIVEDTAIEFHGKNDHRGARWGPGNSPWSAIQQFMKSEAGHCFEVVEDITAKLVLTGMPGGVIRKVGK